MPLSATRLLKLEGAKIGLQESYANATTCAVHQQFSSQETSSSDDNSPVHAPRTHATMETQEKFEESIHVTCAAESDVPHGGKSELHGGPAQTDQPAADALSGMLFQHMHVCSSL